MSDWWICEDGFLENGGRKRLGPFGSSDLALAVRGFVEKAEGREGHLWVSEDKPAVERLADEAVAMCGPDKPIQAVKELRATSGLDLRSAKDAVVEARARAGHPVWPVPRPT